jgi:hypothetical protein
MGEGSGFIFQDFSNKALFGIEFPNKVKYKGLSPKSTRILFSGVGFGFSAWPVPGSRLRRGPSGSPAGLPEPPTLSAPKQVRSPG